MYFWSPIDACVLVFGTRIGKSSQMVRQYLFIKNNEAPARMYGEVFWSITVELMQRRLKKHFFSVCVDDMKQ